MQPVLDDAAALVVELRPAGAVLQSTLAKVNSAMEKANAVATETGKVTEPLRQALVAVNGFSTDPAATGAITALRGEDLATFGGSAFIGLGAIFQTTAAAQMNCNAVALWIRNLVSIASQNDSHGGWLTTVPVLAFNQNTHAAARRPTCTSTTTARELDRVRVGQRDLQRRAGDRQPAGKQPKTTEITGQEAP